MNVCLEHYKDSNMVATATIKLVLLSLFSLPHVSEAAICSNETQGDKLPPVETEFKTCGRRGERE